MDKHSKSGDVIETTLVRAASESEAPPEEEPKNPARRRRALIIVSVIALLFLALGFSAGWAWDRPLGPTLDPGALALNQPDLPDDLLVSPTADAQDASPQCGGPPVMFVMVVGNDSPHNDYNRGFADIIRIVRVDFVTPSVTLLSIPRDMWVMIPAAGENEETANRLKLAYAYGNLGLGEGGGPNLLAQTLAQNFGAQIDHYVVINFAAFEAGIDAIGGVDVYLPDGFDGSWVNLPVYPPGTHHLDGYTALMYARARPDNGSDLDRIERQTDVIRAVQQKAFSPQVFPSIPRLIRSMQSSVFTDFSPNDISSLLCLGQRLDTASIEAINMPDGLYTNDIFADGYEIQLPNYRAVIEFFQAYQAGDYSPQPWRQNRSSGSGS